MSRQQPIVNFISTKLQTMHVNLTLWLELLLLLLLLLLDQCSTAHVVISKLSDMPACSAIGCP